VGALLLSGVFLFHAWRLYRRYSDRRAHRTFVYSIQYLAMLFTVMLVDHYRAALNALLEALLG